MKTEQTWVTFYNDEAAAAFETFKFERKPDDERVSQTTKHLESEVPVRLRGYGVKVTLQKLRRWFATAISWCGVDAKYIDLY